ncbi:MAG: hypothetical protein HYW78_04255 [Parcubacteria group bacterium]|nr:hypothetical protein [Parcubacteria group bacterium]
MSSCTQLKTEYESLQKLADEFIAEYLRVRDSGDMAKAKQLKKELQGRRDALKERLVVSLERACEIVGAKNVLGPQAVEITFGVHLEKIPPIPFSVKELRRAKEFDQLLILRVDKTADNKPLSLGEMDGILDNKWFKEGKGHLLDSIVEWKNLLKNRLWDDAPRPGWALVSKDLLPGSRMKNYLAQTEHIIIFLKEKIFHGMKIPIEYTQAITEFESKKELLGRLMEKDNKAAAEQFSQLKILSLTRQTIQEFVYDQALYYNIADRRLLIDEFIWSNFLFDDTFILFGDTSGRTVGGYATYPLSAILSDIGTILSRRS